jgi:hypothetical protein
MSAEPEETPVFKTWRSITPVRGWPRRSAGVKVKKAAKVQASAKKKSKAERDAFGYRVGSPGATINAILSATPRPVEAIARETGLPATKVSAHLREMIAKGHIAVSPAGFSTK